MRLKERKISGREKDEAAVKLLEQLRGKLNCCDISVARRAAHNLSWMQDDGFDILKEALFGDSAKETKLAAAYGLRKMHGRMKKLVEQVFKQGILYLNSITREVCKKSLLLSNKQTLLKSVKTITKIPKAVINEIPAKSSTKIRIDNTEQSTRL